MNDEEVAASLGRLAVLGAPRSPPLGRLAALAQPTTWPAVTVVPCWAIVAR